MAGDTTFEAAATTSPLGELTTERLEAQICALAGRRAADECAWLLLIAEFDRREGWASWECRSTAFWLSWHCGLSLLAGRERVRTGRALEHLPLVQAEFAAGRLTYSKVRAITRVATPATEEFLVGLGRAATAAQLEQICSAYRSVQPPSSAHQDTPLDEQAQADVDRQVEHLDIWHRPGKVTLRSEMVVEDGALLEAAIATAVEDLSVAACRSGVSAETPSDTRDVPTEPTPRPARLDGLVELARAYLADHAPSPGVERRHLVMLVDVGPLTATGQLGIDDEGRCTIGGHRITPETARQVGCDASTTAVLMDHRGLPLSVGRRSRRPTPAQRLALHLRDRGQCRYPGCTSRHVDAHHLTPWEEGGETDMGNLVLLCRFHHHLIHRPGFGVTLDPSTADVEIRRADGTPVADRIADPADAPGRPAVSDHAQQPGEAGTPLALDDIVGHLAHLDADVDVD